MTARCSAIDDVLVVIDLQSPFLEAIHDRERVVRRAAFLVEAATLLDVPVFATEQVPDRLGATHPAIREVLGKAPVFAKTAFSLAGCADAMACLADSGRRSVILVGVETHICVCASALDLLSRGFRVTVCPDATSSRALEAHKLGMERIRDAGAMPAHTESVAYEWMRDSTHPRFRDVLAAVKRSPL